MQHACEDNPFKAGLVNYIKITWEQYEPSLRVGLNNTNTLTINFDGKGVSIEDCKIKEEMTLDLLSLTKEDVEEGIGGLLRDWAEPKVHGQEYGGLFDDTLTIYATITLQKTASEFVMSRNSIVVTDETRTEMYDKKIYDFVVNKEYETLDMKDYKNSYNDVLRIVTNTYFDDFGREKLNDFINSLLKQALLFNKKRVSERIQN